MGLIYTEAVVQSLDKSGETVETKFRVDTNAIDCLIPTSRLIRAGVWPEGTDIYKLADGRAIELSFGWARIQFKDSVAIAKVIFGPEGAESILGSVALESAGLVKVAVAAGPT